jgi:phage gp36-like protein
MAYATKQQMIASYGEDEVIQVTDRAVPPTGEIDDAVLDQALEEASALIDTYVAKRYDLPLASTPTVLRNLCMVISFYQLTRNRYTEEIRKAYDDAMTYLKSLSAGHVILDVGGTEPKSAPAQIVSDATPRSFSRKDKWY